MPLLNPIPETRPVSDLRTRLSEIESYAQETGEPVVLTRNGAPSLVVIDSRAYNAHLENTRHAAKLREAEIEERYKTESLSLEDSRRRIEEIRKLLGGDDA